MIRLSPLWSHYLSKLLVETGYEQVARDTVDSDGIHVALDERTYILYELIRDIITLCIDPLARNKLDLVGDLVYVLDVSRDLVRIVRGSDHDCHHAGITLVAGLDGSSAALKGFQKICSGGAVSSCSLQG